ncbi:hypothetical protein [Croceivirga radicis]|uniref:hypothetical protein n=1 Tax=Croceivirga radicis TaxID=1929488 RepID=UPI000255AC08|nr:hypothetical protein [Croceivirga radicis]
MRKVLFIVIAAIVVGLASYFAFIYYVPFSEGYRSGELIKFSRKGVMVKTWEGEISQGISGAQIFSFSVQDSEKEVIQKLKDYQGEYVKVTYIERYSTFFWLGDTKYFITDVKQEKSPHFNN